MKRITSTIATLILTSACAAHLAADAQDTHRKSPSEIAAEKSIAEALGPVLIKRGEAVFTFGLAHGFSWKTPRMSLAWTT